MALKTLNPEKAAAFDQEMMSSGGFSIDQLMELAGLAVSQAVYRVHPPTTPTQKRILIACGPGNNGGDGLVCARHLHHFGYTPTVYYPKPSKPELFQRLQTQLRALKIPILGDDGTDNDDGTSAFRAAIQSNPATTSLIIDALFGFSFKGPLRAPFDQIISLIENTSLPVLSVDAPSSWDVEKGPPPKGEIGHTFMPEYLVSLTAAKPCVKFFKGTHFVGGRFLGREMAEKYELEVPGYRGDEQVVEVPVEGKL
ncbi:MAG: hypothetical protein Q9227_003028 [Pyrenula ochraceoflavens]